MSVPDTPEPLVQYILIRSDLYHTLKWPLGALTAQACHASTAVNHIFREDPFTIQYLSNLDSMHKVVLEAPDEESVLKVSETLKDNGIDYKLWIEQPENIATCIAAKPYPRNLVKKYFKKFKLFK